MATTTAIKIVAELAVSVGGAIVSAQCVNSDAGINFNSHVQTIGVSAEEITFGEVDSAFIWVFLKNLSTTNFIEISVLDSEAVVELGIIRLDPSDPALFKFENSANFTLRAASAGADLQIIAASA